MNESDHRFWPFKPRVSVLSAAILLVGLLLLVAVLRVTTGWPGEKSETTVLLGVLVLSLLPVLLTLLDLIVDRGASIEYAGVKINFSQVPNISAPGFTVPVNIGVRGEAVTDSSTTEILDALRQSTSSEVVIIDLETGQAWWETRLLVLLAGAVRLKKPEKIVFVGMDGGIDKCFEGWSHPHELLSLLLRDNPQYSLSYHKAMAAARQWEMAEPVGTGVTPVTPPWIQGGLASQHQWMAFDPATGLPNELYAEQLLQSELGATVESAGQTKSISLVRLEELFRPVLNKEAIDETWPSERQMSAFFKGDASYIAVTRNKQYTTLISRMTVLNSMLKQIAEKT